MSWLKLTTKGNTTGTLRSSAMLGPIYNLSLCSFYPPQNKNKYPSRALLATMARGSQATAMEIHTLEALSDNYMYLIVDASTRAGAVVDPADPDVVMEAVQRLGVTLTHVLTNADMYVPRPPYCTYAARVPVSYV